MKYIGNEIWHKATDNADKTIISVPADEVSKLCHMLELNGLNYFAYSDETIAKIAINKSDINTTNAITSNMYEYTDSKVSYSPPDNNNFGKNYRYIPRKAIFSGNTDIMLKVAQRLQEKGIEFSGHVYNQKTTKITVSEEYLLQARKIKNTITDQRQKSKSEIHNKYNVYFSNISESYLNVLKPYLFDSKIEYSTIKHKTGYIFSLNSAEDKIPLYQILKSAQTQVIIYDDLHDRNFTVEQIKAIKPFIDFAGKNQLENLIDHIKPEYNVEQLVNICQKFKEMYLQPALDRMYDQKGILDQLLKLQADYDKELLLYDICANKNYNSEQIEMLKQGIDSGVSSELLSELNESYSADEIHDFIDIYKSYNIDEINAFFEDHTDHTYATQEKSFSEQVDDVLNGTLPFYTNLKVCDTPQILLDVGCSQFPMLYTQKHLKDAIKPIDSKNHHHGLTVKQIKKLPELLSDPVMIFDSPNRKDSIIVVTSESDIVNNPIIASIKPNGKGRYEVEDISSNFITSVYGRNKFPQYMKKIIYSDDLLFCNKTKSQELFERWGEQYSELTNNLDFDNIIHQSRNIVNNQFHKIDLNEQGNDSKNVSREPTKEELMFGQTDLAKFLAERTPSSDEWEDMAYPLFKNGYLDAHNPSDKASFGYHMSEPALYDLARRFHDGEDIRRELALGLLEGGNSADIEFVFEDGKMSDRTYYYAENLRHSIHTEKTEDGYNCSFGGMERFVSFEEIGQAFIDRIHEEFDDLAYWAVLDYIKDDIPNISDDTVRELITAFDGAALHGWEDGDNQSKLNRIKKALFDVLGNEEKTEKAFACVAKHKYNVTFEQSVSEQEKSFSEQVDDVLAGKANRYDDIKVCDTPQILLDVGCEQLPMLYTQNHLKKAVKPKNLKKHTHGLDKEQIKKLPLLLENPVMIYDSLSRKDSLVVVTSEFDNENNPIIVSIYPNGDGKYNLERVNSNFITSVHGRENFVKHLEKELEADNLLYVNKEKSQELFSVLGLQFSKGLNSLDFNNIIHQSRNIVNSSKEKNIEPTITCDWSESNAFEDGKTYSVAEFDSIMKRADYEWTEKRQAEIDKYGDDIDKIYEAYERGEIDGVHQGYAKTKFIINMPDGRTITERQDIGDGYGGVVDFLRSTSYKNIADELEKYIDKLEPTVKVPEQAEEESSAYQPYEEEVFAFDGDIRYYIKENDEHTLFNVQVQTHMETPDTNGYIYSGLGKFCDTLDEAHAFIEQDIAERTAAREQNAPANEVPAPENGENFAITDDNLGEGGAKTKFKANIAAIQTLKLIESEHRQATPIEQQILSQYVGWGGLASAFDNTKKNWTAEYTELKELLTDSEYASARASTLDSFYTSPIIIDSIYKALDRFGFKGGNVLEPAMGIGNFFGRMPDKLQRNSKLYGVEIDSISGRIAKQLYPNADIQVKGFEKTNFQDGSFDVAVGNVPFGDFSVNDREYDSKLKIHDYFFLKALDKVKVGGIAAFITSTGTLDKQDSSIRAMIAEKADLIGAVRLPNTAFKANAGTEVTSDIIFLQKRSEPPQIEPEWVQTGSTADGLPINKYFENHPDMVLGKIVPGNKLYGGSNNSTMVIPFENSDLEELLNNAVQNLNAVISGIKTNEVYANQILSSNVIVPEKLRNYSFFEQNGTIYIKLSQENGAEWKKASSKQSKNKVIDYIKLRDCTRAVLEAQEHNCSDEELHELQSQLNTVYDDFYSKHGLLHSKSNKALLREDISYPLVSALESEFEDNKLIQKSDLFNKRTIKPVVPVTHVDTAQEALTVSISEKACVDLDYMSGISGIDKDIIIEELHGLIYPVPDLSTDESIVYQEASEYLSGDIYKKLDAAIQAAKSNNLYAENVTVLKQVLPEPLKAGDITIRPGATWIKPQLYEKFVYETFDTPNLYRNDKFIYSFLSKSINIEYSESTGSWNITNKAADKSITATRTYGTADLNAYQIFENILNLKDPKVYKTIKVGDEEKRIVDLPATKKAQAKANKIREKFADWIFKDPDRREQLVNKYNKLFNCIRPREYDGSHLYFPGMNTDIKLHDHQKNAIAHALYGGNTLLAHSVGAGKTYEMITIAMESKRLGLCNKPLFAVPNHLTEQIGSDILTLYPNANILVATKNDFKKENRQQLVSKIATGNFDVVVIGHTQLGMIPISAERQKMQIEKQISDIIQGIENLKRNDGSKFQVKAMERTRKSLEKQLEKLEKQNQDDIITFEQLGVDKLFIDEAHEFKNLFCPTKLQNVAGISSSASQRALDLFMKCRYLDEKTGNKGVVFATGTPISNSVTELHTMMRYLEYDFLKSKGLQHFDNWVSVFGQQKTDYELAPAGNSYRPRTRISNYSNLPELLSMFKICADVRTADTLNLAVPDCKLHIVNCEPTELQKDLVSELAIRADDVQNGVVEPTEDNMLKITSDGRKVGLDPRLVDPTLEDNQQTKLNQCVENVFKIHQDTINEKSTQIVFCDLGVPHGKTNSENINEEENSLEEYCNFCVYDDIKNKLIKKGIPANEIAFIHDAPTEKAKSELFYKMRKGDIRILIGSTGKMGTGTNVQDRLIAIHDLDIPWRPSDLEQRRGRMVRQGNINQLTHLYRYVTKGTFDAYSYQTLEHKQKFISQIITSKTPARSCEDVDQAALSYSEIKALCTGDERIKEMMVLDTEVKELMILHSEYKNNQYELQDKLKHFPEEKVKIEKCIAAINSDISKISNLPKDSENHFTEFKINLQNKFYTDKTVAAKALETACINCIAHADEPILIGELHGFPITVQYSKIRGCLVAGLKGAGKYTVDFTSSFPHNLRKLENTLSVLPKRLDEYENQLAQLIADSQETKRLLAEPFTKGQELIDKSERLNELRDILNTAAAESAKNKSSQTTFYFEAAKMRKSARQGASKSTVSQVQEQEYALEQ